MMRRGAGLTTLLMATMLVSSETLMAQVGTPGQIELGGYGAVIRFDPRSYGFDMGVGVGLRAGFQAWQSVGAEITLDRSGTSDAAGQGITATRLGLVGITYLEMATRVRPYLGAGYEAMFARGGQRFTDHAFQGVAGVRLPLSTRMAGRAQLRLSYFPSATLRALNDDVVNWGVSAGVSVFLRGGVQPDSDRDGIADRRDGCASTPFGAIVNERGCPFDSDFDGVWEGLDQCSGTATGAPVGLDGCPADTDRDGVPDLDDLCNDTPTGDPTDSFGCPQDFDSDGVLDPVDECPFTPYPSAVDATGCPTDADGDGVFDIVDTCPDTPDGAPVDRTGCEERTDADNDGIVDIRDLCPNTRPGQEVDAVGCALLFEERGGERQPLVLQGVNFATGRANLTTESFAILDEVAASLAVHSEVRIEIGGHTDATGSLAVNMRLSQQRADAVRSYLVSRGVASGRIETRGYGPNQPISTNQTAAGRAQNRRVEIQRITP